MIAKLAGLEEVGDEEDDGQHDAEAAHYKPKDAEEIVVAAHNRQLSEQYFLLASVNVRSEVCGGILLDMGVA